MDRKEAISLEPYVGQINDKIRTIADFDKTFAIKEPMSVTFYMKNGQWRKGQLIGGERFELMSMYLGKRSMILKFGIVECPGQGGVQHMEMLVEEAGEKLNAFEPFFMGIVTEITDQTTWNETNEARRKAEQEELAKPYAENADWGSW